MGKKGKGKEAKSLVPPLSEALVGAIATLAQAAEPSSQGADALLGLKSGKHAQPDDADAAKVAAASSIADFASVCDVNRMDLAKANAIPPLVAHLGKGSVPLKERCAYALRMLVTNNQNVYAFDNTAEVIKSEGSIAALVKLLLGDSNVGTKAKEDACATLRLLARTAATRTAIAKEGAIKILLSLISQPPPPTGSSSSSSASASASAAAATLTAAAVMTSASAAASADEREAALMTELVAEAAFCLGSLAFDHADNRAAIAKEGGLKTLKEASLSAANPKLMQTASYAIHAIQWVKPPPEAPPEGGGGGDAAPKAEGKGKKK